jgi:colanic acid biosynthesis glycosyl transferase WcaI
MTIIVVNYSVYDTPAGGAARTAPLIRALAQNGHILRVLTTDDTDNTVLEGVAGVSVTVLPRPHYRAGLAARFDAMRWHLVAAAVLRRHTRPGDICLVCQNLSLLPVAVMLALTLRRAKIVHWAADEIDDAPLIGSSLRVLNRFRFGLRNFALRRADAVVAQSAQVEHQLATLCRIPADRVVLIERPLLPSVIRSIGPVHSQMRREWGIHSEFVVGCCCEFINRHDLNIVLDAASRLAQRRNIVIAFIGDGAMRAVVEAETQQRALANIRLPPLHPQSQLEDCLAAADIHLIALPSIASTYAIPETFYPLIAVGRPMIFIGDPNAEVARLITRTKCGASVQTAERLHWWIEDLQRWTLLRTDMGAKARALFETRSNPHTWIDDWHALLSTLASSRRRRGTAFGAFRLPPLFGKNAPPQF